MSDMEPTREARFEETIDAPVAPPPGPPPRDNSWLPWAIAGVLAAIVLVLVLLLLVNDDDDDTSDLATSVTSSTTSTTAPATTTTLAATTTSGAPAAVSTTTSTAAPGPTIAPARCTGDTDPAKPALPAMTLYDAWRIGDRDCAEKVATDAAVDTLFKLKAGGPDWEFQGCTEVDEPDPHGDCAFTYEGGSTHFKQRYSDTSGWEIFEVYQVAD